MPYPLELFEDIPPGRYTVGYLVDGWTKTVGYEELWELQEKSVFKYVRY